MTLCFIGRLLQECYKMYDYCWNLYNWLTGTLWVLCDISLCLATVLRICTTILQLPCTWKLHNHTSIILLSYVLFSSTWFICELVCNLILWSTMTQPNICTADVKQASTLFILGNFAYFFVVWILFLNNFFKIIFQEYHHSLKQFLSGRSGFKLFAKVFSRLLTHLSRMEFPTVINWTSPFPF